MLKTKRDINQQDFKIIDLHFVKSLSWSCWSRHMRHGDTTTNGWKLQLNNLAVEKLIIILGLKILKYILQSATNNITTV